MSLNDRKQKILGQSIWASLTLYSAGSVLGLGGEGRTGLRRADPERGRQMTGKREAHVVKEAFHSKELAEALVYQRREQAALMALLHGKAEKETEAWYRLQQMSLLSPWSKDSSVEDIEESWNRWAKDKQVGTVSGGTRTWVYGYCPHLVTPAGKQNCGSSI